MENGTRPLAALSERELEILKLVATGATNQQIALRLFISPNTVKVHLRNIFQKLGVESRTEATMYAVRQGWVVPQAAQTAEQPEEKRLILPRERLPAWQRLFFLAAALLVGLAVFVPPARRASNSGSSPFSDRTSGVLGSSAGTGSSRWLSQAQMPTARARLAVVAYGGQVYAIAGDTEEGPSAAVEVYDPATDTWTRRSSKPQPVRNVGAAVLNDRIYVPGGYNALDQATATLEVYDPQTDQWSEAAPLPTPLFAYAIAAVGGRLYLFGGSDGVHDLNTVWIYDPLADAWSSGTAMSMPRSFCAAAVANERIYVLGGYDGEQESALCQVYDPAREGSGEPPWQRLASLRTARGGLAAVAVENDIYAIGGGWAMPLSFHERYDVSQNTWTAFDSPVLGQWRTLGAAAVPSQAGATIHVVGGWSDRYLSTNYAYPTFFRIYLPGS
ncbi:MAG: hypothetical protein FJ026_00365 [Chloroflexi bacterium]|nr:hypothetical protein [Chloroflexota bacterium]